MTSYLKEVTVLVPGRLNPHALARVRSEFRTVEIAAADAALLDEATAQSIRAIASMTTISADLMRALPNLEIVANFGVGYDAVDARHAGANGIMVTNTPDVLTDEVADTTIGLLLNTVRELSAAERHLRDGHWAKGENYRLTPLTLRGRRVGIFGLGRIGLAIARRLEAFGVSVAYHNRRAVDDVTYAYHPTLLALATAVDTLIVVVPSSDATFRAVNADVLTALGRNGVLINIGRGSTVDEEALIKALHAGTIAAAGLDVFDNEPVIRTDFLTTPNLVLLPHVGSASEYTRKAMADLCVDNLISWFSGNGARTPVVETRHLQPPSHTT
ncbi:MAG: 2-hydroxyacid dehydrogenase [Rhizobiaceae bacterium]